MSVERTLKTFFKQLRYSSMTEFGRGVGVATACFSVCVNILYVQSSLSWPPKVLSSYRDSLRQEEIHLKNQLTLKNQYYDASPDSSTCILRGRFPKTKVTQRKTS